MNKSAYDQGFEDMVQLKLAASPSLADLIGEASQSVVKPAPKAPAAPKAKKPVYNPAGEYRRNANAASKREGIIR